MKQIYSEALCCAQVHSLFISTYKTCTFWKTAQCKWSRRNVVFVDIMKSTVGLSVAGGKQD